eukprot:749933-Hanusia_phi.AAC.9
MEGRASQSKRSTWNLKGAFNNMFINEIKHVFFPVLLVQSNSSSLPPLPTAVDEFHKILLLMQ